MYNASYSESLAGSQMELEGSGSNTVIWTLSFLLNSVQIPLRPDFICLLLYQLASEQFV